MRLARFILSYILLSIFALLVSIFLAQNIRLEHLAFFGLDFTFNFVWMLLGAAAFGFLLTLFLFLPSRIALSLHSRRLEREAEQLAQHVAWLQEQREDLLARHEDLLTDHQHLLHQHRRLLADYGAAVAERDQVRTQLASLDTIRLRPLRQNDAPAAGALIPVPTASPVHVESVPDKAQTPHASPAASVSTTLQPAAESEPISANQDTSREHITQQTAPTPQTPPLHTTEPRIAVVIGLVRRINAISERVGQRIGR